ncbi:PREDICTED: zinc finger protein 729-like [Branchiostoma belcheri]|uniref:Zinc finger protein 729-like n=1 Tax=Branchiostoma belcheri TaxID=7741 RepID=A0A6P4YJE6_BRABE|nr:PREDICTED: zinc finger protein 729-like [Branchiostoma belcheri]
MDMMSEWLSGNQPDILRPAEGGSLTDRPTCGTSSPGDVTLTPGEALHGGTECSGKRHCTGKHVVVPLRSSSDRKMYYKCEHCSFVCVEVCSTEIPESPTEGESSNGFVFQQCPKEVEGEGVATVTCDDTGGERVREKKTRTKGFRCSLCRSDVTFPSLAALRQHRKDSHGGKPANKQPNRTEQQLETKVESEGRLKLSQKSEPSVEQEEKVVRRPKNHKRTKDVECPVCHKLVSHSMSLNRHLHSHNKSAECLLCHSKFQDNTVLKTHIENLHMAWVPSTEPSGQTIPIEEANSNSFPVSSSSYEIGESACSNEGHTIGNSGLTIASIQGVIESMSSEENLRPGRVETDLGRDPAEVFSQLLSTGAILGGDTANQDDGLGSGPGLVGNMRWETMSQAQSWSDVTYPEDSPEKAEVSNLKESTKTKLTCTHCQARFTTSCQLSQHLSSSHGLRRTFQCEDTSCRKVFETIESFKEHTAVHSHKPYKCRTCESCFVSKMELQKHQESEHKIEKGVKLTWRDYAKYSCPNCVFRSRGYKALQRHMAEESHSHMCKVCGRICTSRELLKSHMVSHNDQNSFLCEECGRGFKSSDAMRRHRLQRHSEQRNHICPHCGLRFKLSNKLGRHIRTVHATDKPHKCHMCDRAYTRRDKLRDHLMTHTNERPYKCSYCSLGFNRKDHLNDHVKLHTGDFKFHCPSCGKGFTREKYMKEHKCTGQSQPKTSLVMPPPLPQLHLPVVSMDGTESMEAANATFTISRLAWTEFTSQAFEMGQGQGSINSK